MARFDRRVNYPLFDKADSSVTGLATNATADTVIAPVRVGGVIKSPGVGIVPINIVAGRLTHPFLYKIPSGRYSNGGTSRFFGSRR